MPERKLSWEDREDILRGRNEDPSFIIFFEASGTGFPVCKLFIAIWGTDHQSFDNRLITSYQREMPEVLASDIISCRNDEKSVVSVRPNASSFFALAISIVNGREAI